MKTIYAGARVPCYNCTTPAFKHLIAFNTRALEGLGLTHALKLKVAADIFEARFMAPPTLDDNPL